MNNSRIAAASALCAMLLGWLGGCSPEDGSTGSSEPGASVVVSITLPGPSALGLRSRLSAAGLRSSADSASVADVTSIIIEVPGYIPGQPLTRSGSGWTGTLQNLPTGEPLTFIGHAFNGSTEIFRGSSQQTLVFGPNTVALRLGAVELSVITFPVITAIHRPDAVYTGDTAAVRFEVTGASGESLTYTLTSATGGGSFTPSSGTLALTGTNGNIVSTYTPPTTVGDHSQTLRVSNAQGNAVEVQFAIQVVNARVNGGVDVTFNPVVTGMMASRSGSNVKWTATVSDDGPISALTYLWQFSGGLSFVDPTTNPATLAGYNQSTTGTIQLSVTDGNGGTTTVSFTLPPGLFPDAVLTSTDTWSPLLSMVVPVVQPASGVIDDTFYLAGGTDNAGTAFSRLLVQVPGTGWVERRPMPTARWGAAACVMSGKLWVIGGQTDGASYTNVVEIYDPGTDQWSLGPAMPTTRSSGKGVVVDSICYVIGGNTPGGGYTAAVEAFDPAAGGWSGREPLPTPRYNIGASAWGRFIYVFGGTEIGGPALSSALAFDTAANSWTALPSMSTTRVAPESQAVNGLVYVMGGSVGPTFLSSVVAFDPTNNTWSDKAPMKSERHHFGSGVVNGKIVVAGGNGSSGALFAAEEYTPVTLNPGAAPFAYIAHQVTNNVSVIDTATNTVVASVAVGSGPFGVAVNPGGTRVYVANFQSNNVSVIDAASNAVVASVAVGSRPFGVAVSPPGTRAYVTNSNDNTVSVIDTTTNTVVATVAVGTYPIGVAVNPAGSRAYIANQINIPEVPGNVSVIDTASNIVVATVEVGLYPSGVAINPAGTRAYVTNRGDNTVSVIDTATNTIVATVAVGTSPFSVAINPAGTRAYVPNHYGNDVSVIDTVSNTVIRTVAVGIGPTGVALSPAGTRVYVANYLSKDVSVVDTASNTVVDTVAVGNYSTTFGIFIDPGVIPSTPNQMTMSQKLLNR